MIIFCKLQQIVVLSLSAEKQIFCSKISLEFAASSKFWPGLVLLHLSYVFVMISLVVFRSSYCFKFVWRIIYLFAYISIVNRNKWFKKLNNAQYIVEQIQKY